MTHVLYTPIDVQPLVKQLKVNKPARKVSKLREKSITDTLQNRASRHFSTRLNMDTPESSVRRLKSEYLSKVKEYYYCLCTMKIIKACIVTFSTVKMHHWSTLYM